MRLIFQICMGVIMVRCAVGWLSRYISNAALLWYIQEKKVPLPSDEEMKEGTRFVVEHMVSDFFPGKRK